MEIKMPKQDLFKLSDETAAIVRYLRPMEKGTSVSYSELSRHVGVRLSARSPKVIYARFMLTRDANQVWTCVRPNVGLRRLNDAEIAERLPKFFLGGARS